jgi:lysophospholipase
MKVLALILVGLMNLTNVWGVEEKMDYIEHIKKVVLPFYQTKGQSLFFKGKENIELSAIKFINPEAHDAIVVLPGWSETHAKYLEVIYDLYHKGYSVYALDHRGQGFSKHLVESNSQISYVEKFDYYVDDLKTFMDSIVLKEVKDRPYLLAHSMGGAISLFYLQNNQHYFKAAVLCSPMLQINTKPYPSLIANGLIGILKGLGKGKNYPDS